MAYKELQTRIKWCRDTSANWTSNNPVLLDGEIIIVDTDSGETRFKIGDGVKTYTQLPFEDEAVRNLINNKVDKVDGKGLSTNDYTTDEKEKLAGVEAGAQVNVQADWEQSDNTADDYVKNRTHRYVKDALPGYRSETFNLLADYQRGDIIKMKASSGFALKSTLPANKVISTDFSYDLMLVVNFYDTNLGDSTITYSLSNYWRNTEYIDEANLACRVIIRNVHCFTLYLIYDTAKLSEENAVKFDATGIYLEYIALSDNITQYCNVSMRCDMYSKLDTHYLENVIKPTPQSLTDEQKTQARTNIDAISEQDIYGKLDLSGGTMTGSLILSADPAQDLEASTKQYVDNKALIINASIAELSTDVAYINSTDNESITDIETGNNDEVYILKDGETLDDVPETAKVVYDPSEVSEIHYFLTEADKTEIAQMAADLIDESLLDIIGEVS